MQRIVSGIQPTGKLHLGNYFGALVNWKQLQNDPNNKCFFFLADLHALTVPQDPKQLRENIVEVAATLLAVGIDPTKSTLFAQSDVPEHTQLSWVLSCLAPFGEMERMIQFKEKSEANPSSVNVGLFSYPILQAADILLYRPDLVPVGIDQAQHLELTRTLARKFNNQFCPDEPLFIEPKTLHTKTTKIIGLDGSRKMSKSYNNYIALTDSEDELMKKLRAAQTDPARVTLKDPGNPNICNVFSMHKMFSTPEVQEWAAAGCQSAEIGCMSCKKSLFESFNAFIAPIRSRYKELLSDKAEIERILTIGAEQAREEASKTLAQVYSRIGLK